MDNFFWLASTILHTIGTLALKNKSVASCSISLIVDQQTNNDLVSFVSKIQQWYYSPSSIFFVYMNSVCFIWWNKFLVSTVDTVSNNWIWIKLKIQVMDRVLLLKESSC